MNEKRLAKILKEAAVDSILKTGYKEVMQYIKGTKLIVLSTSLPNDSEMQLKKVAEESGIEIIEYSGNSALLGRLCSVSYGTSVVSLKNVSEEEISELKK